MPIQHAWQSFLQRNRYAVCCLLSVFAGLLGFVNPVLSSTLAAMLRRRLSLTAAIATFAAMVLVKGLRMFLRSRVTVVMRGHMRAPYVWLRQRIGRRLWWLEPMVASWGWAGTVLARLSGPPGVSAQAAAAIASTLTDTFDAAAAFVVYYFTQSYVLSLLASLAVPALAVFPWASRRLRPERRPQSARGRSVREPRAQAAGGRAARWARASKSPRR